MNYCKYVDGFLVPGCYGRVIRNNCTCPKPLKGSKEHKRIIAERGTLRNRLKKIEEELKEIKSILNDSFQNNMIE